MIVNIHPSYARYMAAIQVPSDHMLRFREQLAAEKRLARAARASKVQRPGWSSEAERREFGYFNQR
ncbi:MAG: hypothetical protein HYX53_15520 [Chloroflexi bacterium]|nr:hypothetical protein [Chloroflexota bacterium]